jgi:type I restriction enzyme M protein
LKVRKKTPLLLKQFEDFLRLLPSRAESELSWTVDMDERKRVAADEARPFKNQSIAKNQEAAQLSQRVTELKKATPRNGQAVYEVEAKVKELAREARDLAAKAKEIEDSVYDLKAVNPHKRPAVDTRTPEELMNIIEAKGKEVADAVANLRIGLNAVP